MSDSSTIRQHLRGASRQIETTMSLVRAVLIVLVTIRLLSIRWDEILAGGGKHWFALTCLSGGLLLSAGIVVGVRRVKNPSALLVLSSLLDVGLAFLVVLPSVLYPHEHYLGVLRAPDFGIWPLAVVAAGVRLSRSTAVVGSVAGIGAVGALVAIDYTQNVEQVAYRNADAVMAFALLFSASLLAVRLATWVRSLVASTAAESSRAARTQQVLGAYVSPEVASIVQNQPMALGGESRDVAVLFSDLRGFTTYSSEAEPAELIREVNEYFEAMVSVIRANGGVVDKYIGDAIMVVFGIPEHRGDEATRAVRTADAMQTALKRLNRSRVERDLPPMRHGVGIHYGTAIAGNVGTLERLQYTVLGDTVNYASRLEAATKELGVQVLLSEAVVRQAGEEGCSLILQRLTDIEVRGRPGRHTVFTTPDGSDSVSTS